MDAATLYLVLTMTDGSQSTERYNYETMRDCKASAEFLRAVQQANPSRRSSRSGANRAGTARII